MLALKITLEVQLAEAFEYAISNPSMRVVIKAFGFDSTLEQFLAHEECFTFVTFDPIDQPTSEPLKADLLWIWLTLIPLCLLLIWIVKD